MPEFRGTAKRMLHEVVHAGVRASTSVRLRKQLIVTNLLAILIGVITLFWFTIYKIFWSTVLEPLMFVVIATAVIVPLLNARGFVTTSRMALLGVSSSAGAAYAVAMGPEAGITTMFLPLVCTPLALFDLKDRAVIAATLPYPILLAVGVEWYQVDHGALLTLPAIVIETAHTVSLITAGIMVVAIMSFLFSVHASSEARMEQRYRELVRQGEDVVIFLDASGCILETNREARRALGYGRGELTGVHIGEVDRMLCGHAYERLLGTLREEGPQTLRHHYMRKDGSEYPVELRIGMIPEDGNQVLAAAHDASERDALEARLRLTDRLASVGTLAAGVAHEVNNPLAYITLNLGRMRRRLMEQRAIQDPGLRREVLESLEMAIEGSEKVSTIVNDLKTFSRGSSDTIGPVDVERVLEATLKLADHHIRQTARVKTRFCGVPPVDGNEARLGQVFLNLLLNAAQAMTRGSDVEELRLSTAIAPDGQVCVEIRDTGAGILQRDLSRIFDPFFTTKKENAGTGLGLYVCRNIMNDCGGDLQVSSRPGEGTVMKVMLRAAHCDQIDAAPEASLRSATPTADQVPAMRARTGMVAERPHNALKPNESSPSAGPSITKPAAQHN